MMAEEKKEKKQPKSKEPGLKDLKAICAIMFMEKADPSSKMLKAYAAACLKLPDEELLDLWAFQGGIRGLHLEAKQLKKPEFKRPNHDAAWDALNGMLWPRLKIMFGFPGVKTGVKG